MVTKDEFADTVHSARSPPSKNMSHRPVLQDLRQEVSRPRRKPVSKHYNADSEIPRPKDETQTDNTNRLVKRPRSKLRRKQENVSMHRALEPTIEPHTSRPSKRGQQFDIHIPEDPTETPPSSSDPIARNILTPRPRTSRGQQDETQPPPSFTSMFPPVQTNSVSDTEMLGHGEVNKSKWSMTSSDFSAASPADTSDDSSDDDTDNTPRDSRFLEGSMNDRSKGIASSWPTKRELNSDLANGMEDDETTPKAAKAKDQSKVKTTFRPQSYQSVFNKALPPVPAKAKLQKGHNFNDSTSDVAGTNVFHFGGNKVRKSPEKTRSRGLRSSISTFNIQGLSDKFKIFGSKSNGSTKQDRRPPPIPEEESVKALMDDRKRKAEAAYAEQFGFKKHKGIDGTASKPVHFSRPLANIQNDSRATLRGPSPNAPSPTLNQTTSMQPNKAKPNTIKKRPSRRDLEKENAHLRALLKQSTSQVNLSSDAAVSVDADEYLILSPGKGMGLVSGKDDMEDIPPVPSLPFEKSASESRSDADNKRGKEGEQKHDPLSYRERRRGEVIADAVENDTATGRKVGGGADHGRNGEERSKRVDGAGKGIQWEWPEDCF